MLKKYLTFFLKLFNRRISHREHGKRWLLLKKMKFRRHLSCPFFFLKKDWIHGSHTRPICCHVVENMRPWRHLITIFYDKKVFDCKYCDRSVVALFRAFCDNKIIYHIQDLSWPKNNFTTAFRDKKILLGTLAVNFFNKLIFSMAWTLMGVLALHYTNGNSIKF